MPGADNKQRQALLDTMARVKGLLIIAGVSPEQIKTIEQQLDKPLGSSSVPQDDKEDAQTVTQLLHAQYEREAPQLGADKLLLKTLRLAAIEPLGEIWDALQFTALLVSATAAIANETTSAKKAAEEVEVTLDDTTRAAAQAAQRELQEAVQEAQTAMGAFVSTLALPVAPKTHTLTKSFLKKAGLQKKDQHQTVADLQAAQQALETTRHQLEEASGFLLANEHQQTVRAQIVKLSAYEQEVTEAALPTRLANVYAFIKKQGDSDHYLKDTIQGLTERVVQNIQQLVDTVQQTPLYQFAQSLSEFKKMLLTGLDKFDGVNRVVTSSAQVTLPQDADVAITSLVDEAIRLVSQASPVSHNAPHDVGLFSRHKQSSVKEKVDFLQQVGRQLKDVIDGAQQADPIRMKKEFSGDLLDKINAALLPHLVRNVKEPGDVVRTGVKRNH